MCEDEAENMEDVKTMESTEGRSILGEVDQNSLVSQRASQVGTIKAGSWKRKAKAKGKEKKQAHGWEKKMLELRIARDGKEASV